MSATGTLSEATLLDDSDAYFFPFQEDREAGVILDRAGFGGAEWTADDKSVLRVALGPLVILIERRE